MEFSYKISESEFRRAWHVERKASSRASLKTAAFWICIMLGLLLVFKMLQPDRQLPGLSARQPAVHAAMVSPASNVTVEPTTLERVGPFLVIAGIWILLVGGMIPMRLRRLYRKDPRMQGQFTVNITPEFVSTENTAGTTSKCSWNVYDYWCEGKNMIVLTFHSGSYFIMSLAGLSEPQQGELRGILKTALRKK
jgi:hypothetical protein